MDLYTKSTISSPTATLFKESDDFSKKNLPLIIHGQGVFIFENKNNDKIGFSFYNKERNDGLRVELNTSNVIVTRISSNKQLIDSSNNQGLTTAKGSYYWFNLDSQNQRLFVGIGEARLETKIYTYLFPSRDTDEWEPNKAFLEGIVEIDIQESTISPMRLLRDPITTKVPLKVRDTNLLTMDEIAQGLYLPNANLPNVAQKLYNCVSGKKFVLDDNSFPEFSQAIEYSIATPGCWCHETLLNKSTEFNKDKPNELETYLRITLGENDGESPGIPYVLEVWPVGHYSPIHSHAASHAIVRVLHGSINVNLYPFLCAEKDGIAPFGNADFDKDDITWITPTLNQIHQLKNLDTNKDTCITIQCYMYDEANESHYDYFDYIDEDGKKQQYEPDSDMGFVEFKEKMRKEWKNRPKSHVFSTMVCKW